jgi:hypothetical protein
MQQKSLAFVFCRVDAGEFRLAVELNGQSEPAATNAPVGRSVHWMGCIFSFGAGWGSSQSISFCC